MRIDPMGQSMGTQRRGFGLGSIRWIVLIGFAIYAAISWMGSAKKDPYTGETAHYGASHRRGSAARCAGVRPGASATRRRRTR